MNNARNTSWHGVSTWYNKEVGQKGHFFHQSVIIPEVTAFLSQEKVGSLLDLACGQGVLERSVSEKVAYIGVDIAAGLISQAKAHPKNKTAQFYVADVSKPISQIQGLKVDAVTCILALQNIEDFQGFFAEASSHVKDGGFMILVINHPYFRIPRFSGWDVDEGNGRQKRWVSHYMSEQKIPIDMHPGEQNSQKTWSFHVPFERYVDELRVHSFAVTTVKELGSSKQSVGKHAKRENVARSEIPLFMLIVAQKILTKKSVLN